MTADINATAPLPTAQEAILSLVAARKGKTICPTEAARLVGAEGWRRVLPLIRQTAVHLARSGQISIYRHNKPVDPTSFRGVYRLGPPAPQPPVADEADEAAESPDATAETD